MHEEYPAHKKAKRRAERKTCKTICSDNNTWGCTRARRAASRVGLRFICAFWLKKLSSYAPASFAQPAPEKQSSICQRQKSSTLALAPRWAALARRKPWPCGSGDTHHLLELQAAASRSDPQASAEAQCQAQFAEQDQDHGASQEDPGA